MYNAKDMKNLIKTFTEVLRDNVNYTFQGVDIEAFMESGDVDFVRQAVRKLQNNVIASIPNGIPVPKCSMYVSPIGEPEITMIHVSISNKVYAEKKFKYTFAATRGNTLSKLEDFFATTYVELIIDDVIGTNLQVVNQLLDSVVKDAGLEYSISIVPPVGNTGKKIVSLSDDEIVFVADEDRALALDDVTVFQEVSEDVSGEDLETAYNQIVEDLMGCQTVEQLIAKQGGLLVSYICDISKLVRPITLIKKVCTKDATKGKLRDDTVAYFSKGDVYSLVAKRGGHFEVVLSPFNVNTLRKEDFDVLEALNSL